MNLSQIILYTHLALATLTLAALGYALWPAVTKPGARPRATGALAAALALTAATGLALMPTYTAHIETAFAMTDPRLAATFKSKLHLSVMLAALCAALWQAARGAAPSPAATTLRALGGTALAFALTVAALGVWVTLKSSVAMAPFVSPF